MAADVLLAVDALRKLEGLRLASYQDQAGVWTIGYGHRSQQGEICTPDQAERWLVQDAEQHADGIKWDGLLHLSTQQRAALIVLVFNIGCQAFNTSHLRELLKCWALPGAVQEEWRRWCHCDGVENAGLKNRRESELKIFYEGNVMVEQVRKSFMEWLKERLQERTTAAGLALVASWFGVSLSTEIVAQLLPVAGSLLVMMNTTK